MTNASGLVVARISVTLDMLQICADGQVNSESRKNHSDQPGVEASGLAESAPQQDTPALVAPEFEGKHQAFRAKAATEKRALEKVWAGCPSEVRQTRLVWANPDALSMC